MPRIRREATLTAYPSSCCRRVPRSVRDRALAAGATVFLPKSCHRCSLVVAMAARLNQREDGEPPAGESAHS